MKVKTIDVAGAKAKQTARKQTGQKESTMKIKTKVKAGALHVTGMFGPGIWVSDAYG